MKLLLDTANLKDIEYFNKYFPIVGVTTNPTILAREGGEPIKKLADIRALIGADKELHFQVTETEYDGIIEEAKLMIARIGGNTYVKIPATEAGLSAAKKLSEEGYKITVTTVLTAGQALVAANAGAAYVIPYVSRLDNIGGDGIGNVAEIQQILDAGGYKTEIIAASFKTAREVIDTALTGTAAATVGSDVMRKLISHPATDASVVGFSEDWNKAFGGKTFLQMLKK